MATVNYSWTLPTVGGSEDTWGTENNTLWTDLDTLLGGVNATEFAILDGATVTTAELNILDGVTATTAELNILDGVTATTAEINNLSGITAITAAGAALLDDADAAAQRVTLGLGGLATLDILDEDDFVTDSATRPPSQQSVKAYVDGARGQTWQDVSASRSPSTSYQNTTGKTIVVAIGGRSTGASSVDIEVSADNSTWIVVGKLPNNVSSLTSASFEVPDTWYYRTNGSIGLIDWAELR